MDQDIFARGAAAAVEGDPGSPAHKVLMSYFEQHWQPKYVIRFEKQITTQF